MHRELRARIQTMRARLDDRIPRAGNWTGPHKLVSDVVEAGKPAP